MQIKGKMKGSLTKVVIKADNKNDGKTAEADFEFSMTEKQTQQRFGDDFARTAFSDFSGEGDLAKSFVDKKKPGKELAIKSEHLMEFQNGGDIAYPLVAKPKVRDIYADGGRRVTVSIRIPIPATADKLVHLVSQSVGEQLSVQFKGEHQTEMFGDA